MRLKLSYESFYINLNPYRRLLLFLLVRFMNSSYHQYEFCTKCITKRIWGLISSCRVIHLTSRRYSFFCQKVSLPLPLSLVIDDHFPLDPLMTSSLAIWPPKQIKGLGLKVKNCRLQCFLSVGVPRLLQKNGRDYRRSERDEDISSQNDCLLDRNNAHLRTEAPRCTRLRQP